MQLTLSGMRGKVETELTPEIVLAFTKSFASWKGKGSKVVIGRDTRNSSIPLSDIVTSALLSSGIHVYDAGICPTPLILHHIRAFNYDGAVIITGSHNPEDENGIKFVDSSHTFLGTQEIEEIQKIYKGKKPCCSVHWNEIGIKQQIDTFPAYKKNLELALDTEKIKNFQLKVVIDPNAGTAAGVMDALLMDFQCKVKTIHSTFQNYPYFPRKMEPIAENLHELQNAVKSENADVGFAFDCDADRVAVIDQNGTVYPEDTSVLLPLYSILEQNYTQSSPKSVIIVTNIASSLAFEDITQKFGGEVIRTPIGEQYLARRMTELSVSHPKSLIFGGEGSSGGFMYPEFNNARDGIYAACKICEILSLSNKKLSDLVNRIPKYYAYRENVGTNKSIQIINALCKRLGANNISYTTIENDVRVYTPGNNEWTLVHPSNTESVIRIIAESKEKNRSVELVKIMRNLMLQ